METAKLIEHEGFQWLLLPRSVRIEGTEVSVEMDHGKLVLTPRGRPGPETLTDLACYMREHFPQGADFPDIERPAPQQERDLDLDR